MNEDSLFALALGRTPTDRAAFLAAACDGDPALRRRVEALLNAHEQAGRFLDPLVPTPQLRVGAADRPTPTPAAGRYPPDAPPELVAGRYRVVRKLGEGGMGVVYLAGQTAPVRREVALKIVRPEMASPAVLARFEAERQALAMMDHPNIAKVLDGGTTDDGRPFFVMELVDGPPITRYCDEKRMTVRDRLSLFARVCHAVQHAHQKGIIHRDLKPGNVLVAEQDGSAVPKVIDFGIAKAVGRPLTDRAARTELGMVVGTPEYMSPEQADPSALDADTRTDIYALAVLLYELLTGGTPLDRDRLHNTPIFEALRLVREEDPPAPSRRLAADPGLAAAAARRGSTPARLVQAVRGELDWIVYKGLEKDRARRYETAAALAEDVRRYLADEPVAAGPPSRWYRVRKFARRNRVPVAAGAVALAALVAGIAGTTVGMIRARDAEGFAASRAAAALESEARAKAAEADAKAAEARATQDRDVAQAVSAFLGQDLLKFAAPDHQFDAHMAPDPDVRLRTVLDRAAGQIGGKFEARPRIEAELRFVIGQTYLRLSDYPAARPHLERAAALADAVYPAGSAERLAVLHAAGLVHKELGENDLAVRELTAVADGYAALRGPDHPEALTARLSLLQARRKAKHDRRELVPAATALRTDCERAAGADHPVTYRVKLFVAQNNLCAASDGEAEALIRQVLDGATRAGGPDHPQALYARLLLGRLYAANRDYKRAEPLLAEALAGQRRVFGPDYNMTVHTSEMLALLYVHTREFEKAQPLAEANRRWQAARRGEFHEETRQATNMLIDVYMGQGKCDRAIPLCEAMAGFYRRQFGSMSEHTRRALTNLGQCYRVAGRYAEAVATLRDAATSYHEAGRTDDPGYRAVLGNLGRAHLALGRHAEAEQALRPALTLSEEQAPKTTVVFTLRSLLGEALTGRGRYADAEPLLVSGYEGLARAAGSNPRGVLAADDAARRVAALYAHWGKPDRAAAWRSKVRRPEPAPAPRPAR
jgi:serine/threonine protein kinase